MKWVNFLDRFKEYHFKLVLIHPHYPKERLQRIDFAPPVGALVASEYESTFHLKYALGLSVGTKAVYLDENDITFIHFLFGNWGCLSNIA